MMTEQAGALQPQLDEVKAGMMEQLPDDVKEIVGDAARRLAASGIIDTALTEGERAPAFSLPGVLLGQEVSLASLLSRGSVVLVFYRGVWCPYCNLQFKALQEALPAIAEAGGSLVGISPSTPDNSLRMAEKQNLRFDLLSDVGNRVARRFGLVYRLDERLWPIYKGFGIDIPATNGDETYELPLAATYVIDRSGVVNAAFLDTDYTHRMEPTAIIAALNAL